MNLMFTYPPFPIGGFLSALEMDTKGESTKEGNKKGENKKEPIDILYLHNVFSSYHLFEKNLLKEILMFFNSKDIIDISPISCNSHKVYNKGFCFSLHCSHNTTDSLNSLCQYLENRKVSKEYKDLIYSFFKNGAKDIFYSNLINSARKNNFSLFEAIFSSTIYIVSDIKFLLEALYATKNFEIASLIVNNLQLLGMEETIDWLKVFDSNKLKIMYGI